VKGIHIIIVLAGLAALTPRAPCQQNTASFELGSIATPRTINPAANSTNPSSLAGQQQNPFLGSVPAGQPTAGMLELSLADAMDRGLHFNLGVLENPSAAEDYFGNCQWLRMKNKIQARISKDVSTTCCRSSQC